VLSLSPSHRQMSVGLLYNSLNFMAFQLKYSPQNNSVFDRLAESVTFHCIYPLLQVGKAASSHAFGAARHWRFAGGAFTPPLTEGMLTPPWNPSIRFPALTGGA